MRLPGGASHRILIRDRIILACDSRPARPMMPVPGCRRSDKSPADPGQFNVTVRRRRRGNDDQISRIKLADRETNRTWRARRAPPHALSLLQRRAASEPQLFAKCSLAAVLSSMDEHGPDSRADDIGSHQSAEAFLVPIGSHLPLTHSHWLQRPDVMQSTSHQASKPQ